jgi:D-alanine-D-alanine ligase
VAALKALGTRHVGRVDVIVEPSGVPAVLEANVSPGMTETSLLPMAASAAGVSFEDLCDGIIHAAL